MKGLFVGDIHGKLLDLKDCLALFDLLWDVACKERPDFICYLGDQYDTHGIVNVEVQRFYMKAFERMAAVFCPQIALVGNHDRPGDRTSSATSMQVHANEVEVVDKPLVHQGVLFMPYCHDPNDLLKAAVEHADCDVLVCHQTFQGATYENGFYAKDGIDQNAFPQKLIISGHIHRPGVIGKVWYPGSPRWLSISDANIERHVVLYDFDKDQRTFFPTGHVLRRIWQVTDDVTDDPNDPNFATVEEYLERTKAGDHIVVNLKGPMAWCEQRRKALYALRASLRFRLFPTDGRSQKVKESDGIKVAFQKHLAAYQPKHGTPKDILAKMAEERVDVR